MTNEEIQMTKEARIPKQEFRLPAAPIVRLGLRIYFVIRHSSFEFAFPPHGHN
jgi:hypothetical protein